MNILITGASSGIGRQLAIDYAKMGWNLFLLARNEDALNELKTECLKINDIIVQNIICDIRNEKKLFDSIQEIQKAFVIDIVYVNAGIGMIEKDSFYNYEDFKNVINTNFIGALSTIYAVMPKMIERKRGKIVVISSMAAFIRFPNSAAYCISKAGILAFVESISQDVAKYGVNLSVVCPGYINTPMTKRNRFHMPFLMNLHDATAKIISSVANNEKFIVFPKQIYYLIKIFNIFPAFLKWKFMHIVSQRYGNLTKD